MSERSASLLVRLANALSVSRICAVPAIVFLIWRAPEADSHRYAAFWLVVMLHAADILDGYLGRLGSQRLAVRNHFGEMVDPFADKTYIGAAFITLSVTNQFFDWFVVLAIARDTALIVGWTMIYRRYGIRLLPNKLGKVTDASLALSIAVALLRPDPSLVAFVAYATAGLVLASAGSYSRAAARAVAAARFRQLRFAAKLRRKRADIARGGIGPAS